MRMKPLVFLHPLSERLNALKVSLEETAEAENIEIFEIETIDEMREIAPHLGQFLALCSSPKLCSIMLQQNTRILKQEQSKVILLSPKQFPHKIVDRLNKLGLTDLLLDSVAAKTLQYKVKLQLRSIVVKKDDMEEVLFKHEDEEKVKDNSPKINQYDREQEDLSAKKSDEIKKQEEKGKPKEYTGNSFEFHDEDESPETNFSQIDEKENNKQDHPKEKTLADLERSTEDKKSKLPWHKAKEEAKRNGSKTTDKINNVWSSQSNKRPSLKEKDASDLEGDTSTDKLNKEDKGDVNEQEAAIETHWEGEVAALDYGKKKKEYGEEESFYEDNIKSHYLGDTESTDELNEDFETAETNFEENKKDDMVGDSEVEKKKDLLQGDTVKELIQQDDLQTETEGTDEYEGEMQSTGENTKSKEASLLKADFEGRNQINDEETANLEEDRSHLDKDILDHDPANNKWDEDDLSAESETDKSETDALAADSKMDKLGGNLSSDPLKSNKKESEASNERKNSALVQKEKAEEKAEKKKEKANALLKAVRENRKNHVPEKSDGYMRSPSKEKKKQTHEKRYKKRDPLTPLQKARKEKEENNTGDFSADEFINDSGESSTEFQNNDDLFGEGTLEKSLDDMAGDSSVDDLGEDYLEGEVKAEDAEKSKKRKRLEELYELKKEKMAELAEKERKRKEALANEEDLYKKERDWDEKSFEMENIKNHSELEKCSGIDYGSSGQENIEAIKYEKLNHYNEEILAQRLRHKNEEIVLDTSDLSEIERELLQSNKDWGEQTIDYKKIRAGEDGITISRQGTDTKNELSFSEQRNEKEEKIYPGTVLDADIVEETVAEEEGEEIIFPDSKGIESIIKILNTYFTQDVLPSEVLSQVCTLVNKERGFGITSFFYRSHNAEDYIEILNGHESLSSGEKLTQWNNLKEKMLPAWSSLKLPTWSDKTFQEDKIYFYYPYFEGVDHLGFAIVSFSNGMKSENTSRVEVTLEAARAVYLSQRHKENGEAAIYNELKEPPPAEVLPFKLKGKKEADDNIVPERRYMETSDNLILLEKRKAMKEEEERNKKENKKQGGFLKGLWNRMFG